MTRHARASSPRGGGWFFALAFAVLVVGAYLADTVTAKSERPAIGLAALASAAVALLSARAERLTRRRLEELAEARRRDVWRMRTELDEAHARSLRALERAMAAETTVHQLTSVTQSMLAVRHVRLTASATSVIAATPAVRPFLVELPLAAAASEEPPTTLIWPLADLPAAQRQPSLDLPLVPAQGSRVPPLFVPVESPTPPASGPAAGPGSTTESTGIEPTAPPELVDLTATSTSNSRYSRPA
jgi:hypothetical protein